MEKAETLYSLSSHLRRLEVRQHGFETNRRGMRWVYRLWEYPYPLLNLRNDSVIEFRAIFRCKLAQAAETLKINCPFLAAA
jgi:hypothetical protein